MTLNRRDRNKHCRSLVEYVRKGLICKKLEVSKNGASEIIMLPDNCNIFNFLNDLSLVLNKNLSIFDNIMVVGDFNIDFKNKEDPKLEKRNNLYDIYSLENLVESHNCFTKTHKSSIDLLLTNQKSSF